MRLQLTSVSAIVKTHSKPIVLREAYFFLRSSFYRETIASILASRTMDMHSVHKPGPSQTGASLVPERSLLLQRRPKLLIYRIG